MGLFSEFSKGGIEKAKEIFDENKFPAALMVAYADNSTTRKTMANMSRLLPGKNRQPCESIDGLSASKGKYWQE